MQYKLASKLARLLGIHTATRPDIINAVWQYIKVGPPMCSAPLGGGVCVCVSECSPPQSNRLQDSQEREYINNDKYFQQVSVFPLLSLSLLLIVVKQINVNNLSEDIRGTSDEVH